MSAPSRTSTTIDSNRFTRWNARQRAAILAAALAACGTAELAHAQLSGSWTVNASGSWSEGANWSTNPLYPDGGGTAVFGSVITIPLKSITLDVPVTLNALDLSASSGSINFIGSQTLTFVGAATVISSTSTRWPAINVPVVIPAGSTLTHIGTTASGSLAYNAGITGTYIHNTTGLNCRTDMFSTITGAVIINSGTFNLNSPAANPGTGDGRIAGTAGIFLNGGSLQIVAGNKALSDRFDDNDPITFSAGTLQFLQPAAGSGVNEALGPITLSGGYSGFGLLSSTTDVVRLTRMNIPSLARENRGVQLIRGTNLGQNGTYATPSTTTPSSFLKINNLANEAAFVASLVGDPATTYSPTATNLPIVPWLLGDTAGNAAGAGAAGVGSFNTFLSYIVDNAGEGPGFVALQQSNFATSIVEGAVSTNNVRLTNASGSPITLTSDSTVNSLLLAGDGGINGAGGLTVTSGLIGTTQVATNVTIANPVRFGAANDREAIIAVGTYSAAGSVTFSGAISTSGGLTKVGRGTLFLTGSNTYTGPTAIYGSAGDGTLVISSDSNLGTPPATPTAGAILINGGILNITSAATINANRGMTILGNSTLSISSTVTYNGTITDSNGGRTITKVGAGRLMLGGTGNSLGSFSIIQGAVNLGATNALGANVNLQIGFTSTGTTKTLDLANSTTPTAAFDQTVGNLSTFPTDTTPQNDIITNSYTTALGATGPVTFTVNNAAANTFAGLITGDLSLAKSNVGTLTLSGSNTYTGITTVNSGALVLGKDAHAPVLTGGGADVRGGRLILDYSGGGADPVVDVRTALAGSFASGFATGQIHSSTATAQKGLGFLDDTTASRLTVAYTYFGDANLSGAVTTEDFTALSAHFSQSTQNWADGDFNYDGTVNAVDFNMVAANFGAPPIGGGALGTLVPEPAMMGIIAMSLLSLRGRCRRVQKQDFLAKRGQAGDNRS